jgi:hypothetical protein
MAQVSSSLQMDLLIFMWCINGNDAMAIAVNDDSIDLILMY